MRHVFLLIAAVLVLLAFSPATPTHASPLVQQDAVQGDAAQTTDAAPTLQDLSDRLDLVQDQNPGGIMIFVLILYATVCALWAQNTGRHPWLWFFLGLIFSIITAFIILHKNALDLNSNGKPKPKPKT